MRTHSVCTLTANHQHKAASFLKCVSQTQSFSYVTSIMIGSRKLTLLHCHDLIRRPCPRPSDVLEQKAKLACPRTWSRLTVPASAAISVHALPVSLSHDPDGIETVQNRLFYMSPNWGLLGVLGRSPTGSTGCPCCWQGHLAGAESGRFVPSTARPPPCH